MSEVVIVVAGGKRWALPTARVREVAQLSALTPVPTAPPPVVGLTQLRGQIVPVLALAPGGGGEPGEEARAPRPGDALVLVELGPVRAALWVDRVLGVESDGGADTVDVGALFDAVRKRVQP